MTQRQKTEIKERTEAFLNERWMISNAENARPQDRAYYDGAVRCLEFLGWEWKRSDAGKHSIDCYSQE